MNLFHSLAPKDENKNVSLKIKHFSVQFVADLIH